MQFFKVFIKSKTAKHTHSSPNKSNKDAFLQSFFEQFNGLANLSMRYFSWQAVFSCYQNKLRRQREKQEILFGQTRERAQTTRAKSREKGRKSGE